MTSGKIGNILLWLNEPRLVADFQQLCGIIPKSTNELDSSSVIQNGVPSQPPSRIAANTCVYRETSTQNAATEHNQKEISAKKLATGRHLKNTDPLTDKTLYIVNNKFLHYLFWFGASLGNEVFYSTFFPFMIWNVDGFLCRRVMIPWIMVFSIGQITKDIIRMERPASPPVIKLEKRYDTEYGMPSTHAMVGTVIPCSLLYFATGRYQFDTMVAVVLTILWISLVACSRVYLGMHSFLDVFAGILYTFLLLGPFITWVPSIDHFLLKNPYSPVWSIGGCLLVALLYPSKNEWSTARADTFMGLAVALGGLLGPWLNYQLGYLTEYIEPKPYPINWPSNFGWGLLVLRIVIGTSLLVLTRVVLKAVTYPWLCKMFNLDPNDPKTKQKLLIEFSYKFITYTAVSFNVTFTALHLFSLLNINRELWYANVV